MARKKRNKAVAEEASRPKGPARSLSGNCNLGWCEGKKVIPGREGKITPRCKGLTISEVAGKPYEIMCTCQCHAAITEMYEMAGIPREWPDSIWTADDQKKRIEEGLVFDPTVLYECIAESRLRPTFDLDEDATDSVPTLAERDTVDTLEGVLPPNPSVEEDPDKRDGSYRQKGRLVLDVKIVCDQWVLGAHPDIEQLKPGEIARLIDPQRPPSTGAITNVLRKWSEMGFARIGEKPWRFEAYTKAGIEHGFDALHERLKAQNSNRARAATRERRKVMLGGR